VKVAHGGEVIAGCASRVPADRVTPRCAHARSPITHLGGVIAVTVCLMLGCAGTGRQRVQTVEPIRVSDAIGVGDPARRASTRLVLQGLDADADMETDRARGSYERAIQVDATNPNAYLALARHYLDFDDPTGEDAARATHLIDQAAALFEAEGMREPRVGVHLMGLRGRAMQASQSDADAALYLERARALAPDVWGDEYLSPEELR